MLSPRNYLYQKRYFYVDRTVETKMAVKVAIPPTAEMIGMYFGIANTKTIHKIAIPKATQTE